MKTSTIVPRRITHRVIDACESRGCRRRERYCVQQVVEFHILSIRSPDRREAFSRDQVVKTPCVVTPSHYQAPHRVPSSGTFSNKEYRACAKNGVLEQSQNLKAGSSVLTGAAQSHSRPRARQRTTAALSSRRLLVVSRAFVAQLACLGAAKFTRSSIRRPGSIHARSAVTACNAAMERRCQ
jgi:hypothetical protein